MEKRYHFITGLPRSGSTLLSALLRQNPKFHAGMQSPVGSITVNLRMLMSQNPELDTLLDNDQRKTIIENVLHSYYHKTAEQVIFDTHRSWSQRIPELMFLHGDVKLIAMVRDCAWILDSIERITRRNPVRMSLISNTSSVMDARLRKLMSDDGMVGRPLGALKEGIYSAEAGRMLIVDYDALCAQPVDVLQAIYAFLGEDWYAHDVENVEYEQETFDEALRTPDLHKVSGRVRQISRKTVLSPDLFAQYSDFSFWRQDLPDEVPRILLE